MGENYKNLFLERDRERERQKLRRYTSRLTDLTEGQMWFQTWLV